MSFRRLNGFYPLPSGVCWLNVWIGRRNFEMEYHPANGTGISENFDDTPPFIGHDAAFDSLDEAASHFKSLLADASARKPCQRHSSCAKAYLRKNNYDHNERHKN